MAVLPDDPVRLRADHDHAVVVVIVDQDVAIAERQRERGMVERGGAGRPEPPHHLPGAAEDDNLARIGVIGDEVAARAHLVRIGRVADPRRVRRPVHLAVQAHLIHPVTEDLGDQEMPVADRKGAVRLGELARRVMAARRCAAELAGDGPGRQQHDPAVQDVRRQDLAAGQLHGVIRMTEIARPGPGHPRMAVPAGDPAGGDVDHRDRLVHLLRGDDRPAICGDERVIGRAEHLATPEGAGAGEQPADPPVRVNQQQPAVVLIRDQHVPGQRPRI